MYPNQSDRLGVEKPEAVVFVDYEHWYYSYQQMFRMKPDIVYWYNTLKEQYTVASIYFFGDFSREGISQEVCRIREVTNMIIETQNNGTYLKKDMTDFIMLDCIYQQAIEDSCETFILVTGDGHFQSVVRFLTDKFNKEVVVYGVRDSFSRQLRLAASRFVEMPAAGWEMRTYFSYIIENFNYIAEHPKNKIIPTFWSVIKAVARFHELSEEVVRAAVEKMLDEGYLTQEERRINFNDTAKVLVPNWEKLIQDRLWMG